MRIGIFSGSFDPVHCGHAMVANYLGQCSDLDRIWLLPSPLNPLKSKMPPADFFHRYEMCKIIASKCKNVEVSDFEKNLPLPSYTYHTLVELKKAHPDHEFVLIIGSDNWINFDKWRDYKKILSEFEVMIYPRPGFDIEKPLLPRVNLKNETPTAFISSTFLRKSIQEDLNLNYMIDPDVMRYIKNNNLYNSDSII